MGAGGGGRAAGGGGGWGSGGGRTGAGAGRGGGARARGSSGPVRRRSRGGSGAASGGSARDWRARKTALRKCGIGRRKAAEAERVRMGSPARPPRAIARRFAGGTRTRGETRALRVFVRRGTGRSGVLGLVLAGAASCTAISQTSPPPSPTPPLRRQGQRNGSPPHLTWGMYPRAWGFRTTECYFSEVRRMSQSFVRAGGGGIAVTPAPLAHARPNSWKRWSDGNLVLRQAVPVQSPERVGVWGGGLPPPPPPPPSGGAELLEAPNGAEENIWSKLNQLVPKAPENIFDWPKARKKLLQNILGGGGWVARGAVGWCGNPPPPPCDIPSGCCSFTGPWTVTRSSLRMLRRVAAWGGGGGVVKQSPWGWGGRGGMSSQAQCRGSPGHTTTERD